MGFVRPTGRNRRQTALFSALIAISAALLLAAGPASAALSDEAREAAFTPEAGKTNPFLHMGLHLAVRDQVATDRPPGISNIFQQLVRKYSKAHEAEHRILDCLAETLWEAQNRHGPPDEQKYLEQLREII